MPRIVVAGGGIAGLATAYALDRRLNAAGRGGVEVTVLERIAVAGGKVRSESVDGWLLDHGPNGVLDNAPDTLELIRELGLEPERVRASERARRRYLYRDGALRPLPAGPGSLLASGLLSPLGKARVLAELRRPPATAGEEETVYAFLARRFGREAAGLAAEPMVSGVAAGDPRQLSLDALFPRVRSLEREHGSVLRGLAAARRRGAAPGGGTGRGGLITLQSGVGRLTEALAGRLGPRVRTGAGLTAIARDDGNGLRLTLASGERLDADALVLAIPAFETAALLEPLVPEAARELSAIPYADVRVVALGFDRVDVPRRLDGFGFLAPRGEGVRSLGVLWTSSIFPEQAPPGKVALRAIAGGTLDPGFAALSEAEAVAAVRRDLRVSMGVTAEPELAASLAWPRGIPQYLLGHGARVERTEAALAAALPGVELTGNAYRGVGVNDVVRDARRVAERVAQRLAATAQAASG